jgi:hypothetical protein
MVTRLLPILALVALAACGARSTWEPANENVARYGSWTDEALLLSSTQAAVEAILEQHPPSANTAVSIRVPHDPESYGAAALLAFGLESGGGTVFWISDDGVAAPSSKSVEVWEVACTIRGAVTEASHTNPPYVRRGLVEVRVSSLAASGKLLWDARGLGKAYRYVNLYFPARRVLPNAQ